MQQPKTVEGPGGGRKSSGNAFVTAKEVLNARSSNACAGDSGNAAHALKRARPSSVSANACSQWHGNSEHAPGINRGNYDDAHAAHASKLVKPAASADTASQRCSSGGRGGGYQDPAAYGAMGPPILQPSHLSACPAGAQAPFGSTPSYPEQAWQRKDRAATELAPLTVLQSHPSFSKIPANQSADSWRHQHRDQMPRRMSAPEGRTAPLHDIHATRHSFHSDHHRRPNYSNAIHHGLGDDSVAISAFAHPSAAYPTQASTAHHGAMSSGASLAAGLPNVSYEQPPLTLHQLPGSRQLSSVAAQPAVLPDQAMAHATALQPPPAFNWPHPPPRLAPDQAPARHSAPWTTAPSYQAAPPSIDEPIRRAPPVASAAAAPVGAAVGAAAKQPLRLDLRQWRLPPGVVAAFGTKGIRSLFPWQAAALECGEDGSNLVRWKTALHFFVHYTYHPLSSECR